MADDDELASLAEALLAKKRFKTEDELTKIDGRWYWALPQGQRFIPRHTDALQLRTMFKEAQSWNSSPAAYSTLPLVEFKAAMACC
ncbi:hypothetical protein KC365_g70 [Hortaea werneckii]|nr:hypothetical protein KC365_g70 [Hortaea werneckii]